jgi:hypothetical protein
MKFIVKLLALAVVAAPSLVQADNDDRGYLVNLPRSQTFTYESPDSTKEVSLTFEPATSQFTTPSVLHFEDLINHVAEVELFDRLSLLPVSELHIGTRTYPLQCMRVHGSGLASDESDLRFIELFFPLDDPDGQCVGPLNPDYPGTGSDRYRWHKYLTVIWNGQEKRIVDAELYFDGITYNLTPTNH